MKRFLAFFASLSRATWVSAIAMAIANAALREQLAVYQRTHKRALEAG